MNIQRKSCVPKRSQSLPKALVLLCVCSMSFGGGFELLAQKTTVVKSKGVLVDRIIALVGKEIILYSELEQGLMSMQRNPAFASKTKKEIQDEVMKTLIADRLIESEIKKLKLTVTEAEEERAFVATKAQYNLDDAAFAQALAGQGMTLARYKKKLKKQLLKMKLVDMKVKSQVHISDQDVEGISINSKAKAQVNYRIKARHVLFIVNEENSESLQKEKAERALKRLKNGEDFAKVAAEMSEGPSKNSGGLIGVFGRGEMLAEFEDAAYKAVIGEVFGPVRTSVGFHVIEVIEHVKSNDAVATNSDQELQKLKAQLYEEEMAKAFERYIASIKKKQYIEIRDLSNLN